MRRRRLREAFEREALPYLDALYGLALRLTRNPGEAEDLLQDGLVKAFRFYHQFEPGSNLKAWLFKVLTNTFYNRCRKAKNIQRMVIDAELGGHYDRFISESSVGSGGAVEEELLARMARVEIEQAIAELPEDFRLVVILCDVHEFSYREIAEIIERPVGTVMSRLYRARRLLQKKLFEHALEEGLIAPLRDEEERVATAPTDLAAYRRRRGGNE